MNLYSFLKKKQKSFFAGAFFAVVFLLPLFLSTPKAIAQTTPPARTVNDYITLWGDNTTWGEPTKEALKQAATNGIGYFGPLTPAEGGFTTDGTLKKIKAVISLSIDQKKFRAWNMVAGTYYTADVLNNKSYLRLLDQSFVARVFQLDDSGNPINESIIPVPSCSFLDCSNNKDESFDSATKDLQRKLRLNWANQGKPSDRIVKFALGAAMFSNVFNNEEDGYTTTPTGEAPVDFKHAVIGGFLTGGPVGAILGVAANYLVDTGGPILVMRQTAIVSLPITAPLDKGKTAFMQLWYLGEDRMTTADSSFKAAPTTPAPTGEAKERMKFFDIPFEKGDKTFPFFQIGGTYTFTTPTSGDDALTQAGVAEKDTATTGGNLITNDNDILPTCSFPDGLVGCLARVVYYVIYWPIAWVAGILGSIFDFFLGYSISDESYRAGVIVTGWKLIRDISNIFFILILVWTGFSTVFGIGKISMKNVVPQLIINALLINFSLFGTQVVIDISNVTARIFYNTMSVCEGTCEHDKDTGKILNYAKPGIGDFKPLSTKIVSAFNPQKIFTPDILDPGKANPQSSPATTTRAGLLESADYAGFFIIVTLIAAFIMFLIAKMFFGTMFMFLGRVIGLYMIMIFAPFAVVTRGGMPLVGGIKELGWDEWLKELTSYALLAPIFVFFLYIIYAFMGSSLVTSLNLGNESGFLGLILGVAIPMGIIYMLVNKGVDVAKKNAGKAGLMVQGFATKATGLLAGAAVGIASGGVAFAGTRVAGLAKLSEATRTKLIDQKSQGGLSGRLASMQLKLNDRAQSGTFDIRKSKAFGALNTATNKLGFSLNDKISDKIGLGADATKGGISAIEKKEKKEIKDKIESIQTNLKDGDEVKKFWEEKSNKLIEKEKERLEKNEVALIEALKKSDKTITDEKIEELRTNGTLKDTAGSLAKQKIQDDFGKVETNKQLTQAMRIQFAQTIAEGRTFGQQIKPALGITGGAVAAPGIISAAGTLGVAGTGGALAVGAAAGYDANRKAKVQKEEAESYASKAKKANKEKKVDKETRLETQKKKAEEDIADMDKHLSNIDETLKAIFTKETQDSNSPHFGKNPADFDSNPEHKKAALKIYRQQLDDRNDEIDLDIKSTHEEYIKAKREGRTGDEVRLKNERAALIAEKGKIKQDIFAVNEDRRKKAEEDLNKAENELEKIKKDKEAKEEKDKKPAEPKK